MPTSGHFDDYIDGLTEDVSPDADNDFVMTYDTSAAGLKKSKVSTIASGGSGIPLSGWIAADAMTYVSADDPTYVMHCTGDQTTKYRAGHRIKLTQATGGTKYFIITVVAVNGANTDITLYGGASYDLANEAITNPYYSPTKAPFGFPTTPAAWTQELKDTTLRTQATPSNTTYYNIGSLALSVPIGVWKLSVQVRFQISGTGGASGTNGKAGLSTANNSASDADLIGGYYIVVGSTNITFAQTFFIEKVVTLAAKTSYYVLGWTQYNAGNIYFRSDDTPTIVRAICAYL